MGRELRTCEGGLRIHETVSEEESPISPVLPTEEAVVGWLIGKGYTEKAARAFVKMRWSPSGAGIPGKGFFPAIECCEFMGERSGEDK